MNEADKHFASRLPFFQSSNMHSYWPKSQLYNIEHARMVTEERKWKSMISRTILQLLTSGKEALFLRKKRRSTITVTFAAGNILCYHPFADTPAKARENMST
jgi:hypothetical protein